MISFHAFAAEVIKLAGDLAESALPQSAMRVKAGGNAPATNAPTRNQPNGDQAYNDENEPIKTAFAVSQYSGPLSYGKFKQESYIPPFTVPPFKTGGPSSEKKAQLSKRAAALTPAGRFASSSNIGKPKMGPPPGPSIAQLTKPKGFGVPEAGATKSLQSVPGE